MVVRHQICNEAARLAGALSFGEPKIGLLDLGFRSLAVLNVKCSDIPPIDSPLLIELRVVADQEPAISTIFVQDALLRAEWCASPKRCRPLRTDSLKVLRVD